MFTNHLTSILAALGVRSQSSHSSFTAKCEAYDVSDPSVKYHSFVEPELESYAPRKSHYNFIHDSLPYRTTNIVQLRLYDNYMNDVLSFSNIKQWKRITSCLRYDKNDESKQLFCKSLLTDYYIASEDMDSAQSTINSAYNLINNRGYDDLSIYDREELYVFGFYEWIINSDQQTALKIFRYISVEYPFDLYATKRAQEMAFNTSNWNEMLAIFLDIKQYHHVNGIKNPLKDKKTGNKIPSAYYNGLLSFAYEQMGYLNEAEQYALEGLKYYIDDNWLHHSLIHSRYFQKNTENDIKNLIKYTIDNGSKYWDIYKKHAFMTTHNWWHIALLYLELDDIDSVINIFKQHIWRNNLNHRADQIGALSMFWILTMVIDTKQENNNNNKYIQIKNEINGMWMEVMEYIYETNKTVDVGYKLYDLLFIRGVIQMKSIYRNGSGSGLKTNPIKFKKYNDRYNELITEMIEFCGDNTELKQKYIGIINAMSLMYDGDNKNDLDQAYNILSPIIDDLNIIGGSREQRFVFDQMYIDLLLKNNQSSILKEYLHQFLSKYPIKSLEIVASNIPT